MFVNYIQKSEFKLNEIIQLWIELKYLKSNQIKFRNLEFYENNEILKLYSNFRNKIAWKYIIKKLNEKFYLRIE